MKTLLIDNYDSFSHILFQYLWEVNGAEPIFIHNDEWTMQEIRAMRNARRFDNILISPGPGRPDVARDFGVCAEVIAEFADIPILGVCLGHQGIGLHAGARVVAAPAVRHGKLSPIRHDGKELFAGLNPDFPAVRYHSLVIEKDNCPASVKVTAVAGDDGQIMGIQLGKRPCYGVQFHPESIGTDNGKALLANFRDLSARWLRESRTVTEVLPRNQAETVSATSGNRGESRMKPANDTPGARPWPARELSWRDPEAVFKRLFRDHPAAFWLDSASDADVSYMGTGARLIEARGEEILLSDLDPAGNRIAVSDTHRGDPLAFLDGYLKNRETYRLPETPALPGSFQGGLIGYFGYELKRFTEGGNLEVTPPSPMPDMLFLEPDRILAFDHRARKVFACLPLPADSSSAVSAKAAAEESAAWLNTLDAVWNSGELAQEAKAFSDTAGTRESISANPRKDFPHARSARPQWEFSAPKAEYLGRIRALQAAIRRGETYEACLTNEIRAVIDADPFAVYRILRRINPAPYAAFLRFPQGSILSASPERFLKLDARGRLESRPIKGTRKRGADEREDEALRADLASNAKDRSENLMIVDLVRNDFGKVCELGSVKVPELMVVEKHPTVWQLVSEVAGRLAPGRSALDAVRACFPGGSMTGAPKARTMELLEAQERRVRGVFSGALGYLGYDGAMDLGMVIRTLVYQNGVYSAGCGGAILAESDPEAEFEEAMLKASASMRAVESAASNE